MIEFGQINIILDDGNTNVCYKGDVVPGLQRFICDLGVNNEWRTVELLPLTGEDLVLQRDFAAYAVKQGFSVAWLSKKVMSQNTGPLFPIWTQ